MTDIQRTQAIADLSAATLPGLLTTALLDDFAVYQNKSPLRAEDLEYCVYIDGGENTTDNKKFSVIIKCQIYEKDEDQAYHSVIMPFIEKYITAELVDYLYRDSISFNLFPIEDRSTAYCFYFVSFTNQLDDCEGLDDG